LWIASIVLFIIGVIELLSYSSSKKEFYQNQNRNQAPPQYTQQNMYQQPNQYTNQTQQVNRQSYTQQTSRPQYTQQTTNSQATSSTWRCRRCGSVNQSYVSTCRCGENKPR
ncbi:MAG: hypothetical protein Q4A12_06010, partial [Eubacteriales bacterium]|nr:hypothetical protein [Eubacteriales bacterium]